jgi:uncharacterized protein YpiB (UPF0302 family)
LNYLNLTDIIEKRLRELISMKKYFLNAPQNPVVTDHSMLAEMVLEKALRDFQKEHLLKEIDRSLENRNEEEFLRLTDELKKYLE